MLSRLIHRLAFAFCFAPPTVLPFLFGRVGKEHGLGFGAKMNLMRKVFRNARRQGSATTFLEQLTLVNSILSISPNVEGVVAEFGCYKGMSSASLSLACAVSQRKLVIFDSYEGLPDTYQSTAIETGDAIHYEKGQYKGMLDEVKQNIAAGGDVSVCEFVKGYFEHSLPERSGTERYCFIFEDADLASSVRTVLQYAWPRLQKGCVFFTHEARELEVMKMFFDDSYWSRMHGCSAPGLVGAGLGLTLSENGSCLGYVRKSYSASDNQRNSAAQVSEEQQRAIFA